MPQYVSRAVFLLPLFCACILLGCEGDESEAEVELPAALPRVQPSSITAFGGEFLHIDLLPFNPTGDEWHISINDRPCLFPNLSDAKIFTCYAQGSAVGGAATLTITGDGETHVFDGALSYLAPEKPFSRLAVLGADLSAGWRDGHTSLYAQQNSYAAQLARALGAYLPQALVSPNGLPGTATKDDIDVDTGAFNSERLRQAMQTLLDQNTPSKERLDEYIAPANLAIPGLQGADGPLSAPENAQEAYFADLLRAPAEDTHDAVALLKALKPTLVIIGPELKETFSEVQWEEGAGEAPYASRLDKLWDTIETLPEDTLIMAAGQIDGNLKPGRKFSGWERYRNIWWNNALYDGIAHLNGEAGQIRAAYVDWYGMWLDFLSDEAGSVIGGLETYAYGVENKGYLLDDSAPPNTVRLGLDLHEGIFTFDGNGLSDTAQGILANQYLEEINRLWGPYGRNPLISSMVGAVDLSQVLGDDTYSPTYTKLPSVEDPYTPPVDDAALCAMRFRGSQSVLDPLLCPRHLIFADDTPDRVYEGEALVFKLEVLDDLEEVMPGQMVVAEVRSGTLDADFAFMPKYGMVEFTYHAPYGVETDEIRVACGTQLVSRTLSVEKL